jgi:hypothetical protein
MYTDYTTKLMPRHSHDEIYLKRVIILLLFNRRARMHQKSRNNPYVENFDFVTVDNVGSASRQSVQEDLFTSSDVSRLFNSVISSI